MENSEHSRTHANFTMSEAARMLDLSRARFYQLIAQRVFPPPAYSIRTRLPLYPSRLLDVCKDIRRTGIGFNGQLVRFYKKRRNGQPNPQHKHLATILRGMGLVVTGSHVRKALRQLRLPAKIGKSGEEDTVRKLFRHLYGDCQEGV